MICSESSGNEIGREARGAQKKGRLTPTFAALEGSISNNSRKRGAEKGALPVKSSAWTEGYSKALSESISSHEVFCMSFAANSSTTSGKITPP